MQCVLFCQWIFQIRQVWDKKKSSIVVKSRDFKSNKEIEKLLEEISEEKENIHRKYIKALEKKEELEEKNKNLQSKLDEEKRKSEILRGQVLRLQSEINILKNN